MKHPRVGFRPRAEGGKYVAWVADEDHEVERSGDTADEALEAAKAAFAEATQERPQ